MHDEGNLPYAVHIEHQGKLVLESTKVDDPANAQLIFISQGA
jgi:hypothetical protein